MAGCGGDDGKRRHETTTTMGEGPPKNFAAPQSLLSSSNIEGMHITADSRPCPHLLGDCHLRRTLAAFTFRFHHQHTVKPDWYSSSRQYRGIRSTTRTRNARFLFSLFESLLWLPTVALALGIGGKGRREGLLLNHFIVAEHSSSSSSKQSQATRRSRDGSARWTELS